jgi:hypothetical protein
MSWKTVETPEEINTHLLERNRKHFSQAHGTSFTIPPLSNKIDFTTNTEESEKILHGHQHQHSNEDLVEMILRNLQYKTEPDCMPAKLTEIDIYKKFSIWPEKTTTSPSGRHLGH